MKKFLLGMFVLIAFAATAWATSMTAPTVYGPVDPVTVWSWNVATETPVIPFGAGALSNHTASKKDSLVGIDSIELLNHFPIKPGWNYAFQIYDTTGAADSIHFIATIYGSDGKTPMYLRKTIDTIGGATTNKTISLPVNSTVFGTSISMKAFKWIAAKTAKIWRFELIRYRSGIGQPIVP